MSRNTVVFLCLGLSVACVLVVSWVVFCHGLCSDDAEVPRGVPRYRPRSQAHGLGTSVGQAFLFASGGNSMSAPQGQARAEVWRAVLLKFTIPSGYAGIGNSGHTDGVLRARTELPILNCSKIQ